MKLQTTNQADYTINGEGSAFPGARFAYTEDQIEEKNKGIGEE